MAIIKAVNSELIDEGKTRVMSILRSVRARNGLDEKAIADELKITEQEMTAIKNALKDDNRIEEL